jgi:transcriptional regulator with XRE-family HTH domain
VPKKPAAPATPVHASVLAQIERLVAAEQEKSGIRKEAVMRRGGATRQSLAKWRAGSSPGIDKLERLAVSLGYELRVEFVPPGSRVSGAGASYDASPGQGGVELDPTEKRILGVLRKLPEAQRGRVLEFALDALAEDPADPTVPGAALPTSARAVE